MPCLDIKDGAAVRRPELIGEILFTSMDHDSTKSGYPCETYAQLHDCLSIPALKQELHQRGINVRL